MHGLENRSSDGTSDLQPAREAALSALRLNKEANAAVADSTSGILEKTSVTVFVRSKGTVLEMDRILEEMARSKRGCLSEAEFNDRFSADPDAIASVRGFACERGLLIKEEDARSGRMVLQGTARQIASAFQGSLPTSIRGEETAGIVQGTLQVPKSLKGDIQCLFASNNNALAETNIRVRERTVPSEGYLPTQVSAAYDFPDGQGPGNYAVAILQFGGGIRLNDQAQYYKDHGFKTPKINVLEVGEGENAPWDPSGSNAEVSLDSQIVGSVAPELEQNIIFALNNERGFIDAVNRAVFQPPGETPNVSISISWGSPVERWSPQARESMNLAFKKANLKGISVFAASGDGGALDDGRSGRCTTTYPASDPNVTGCGGTELKLGAGGRIASEAGWNGSGGGISEVIPRPDFQVGLPLPENANGNPMHGRSVPDIAGNASFSTSYIIRVDGRERLVGGTSAVAPLMAALSGNVSHILGRPAGITNAFLYRHANSGIFHDITTGDNGAYSCGKGYDAVTGWGSIRGQSLMDCLMKNAYKF